MVFFCKVNDFSLFKFLIFILNENVNVYNIFFWRVLGKGEVKENIRRGRWFRLFGMNLKDCYWIGFVI